MKLFFTTLVICYSSIIYCQTEKPIAKGNIILGGNINGYYNENGSEYGTNYTYSLGVSPNVSYFVIKGLALGISPVYSYKKTNSGKNKSFGIGPAARYYLQNNFYFDLSSKYLYGKSSYSEDLEYHSNSFGAGLGIGYAVFLNSKVALEPMIYYYIEKSTLHYTSFPDIIPVDDPINFDDTYHDKFKTLSFSIGLTVFL